MTQFAVEGISAIGGWLLIAFLVQFFDPNGEARKRRRKRRRRDISLHHFRQKCRIFPKTFNN